MVGCSEEVTRVCIKYEDKLATGRLRFVCRTSQSSLIARPLSPQLINRAVVHVDIHVVFGAGNCVEARGSVRGAAILFARELPDGVALPGGRRKISHVSLEARIPQMRF